MIYSYFVRKETLPIWYFIGIISILAGWLFLYTCPGISVRVKALISYGGDYLSISEIMNMPFTLLLKTIFHTYNRVISRVYHVNYILVSLFLLIISFSYSRVLENFLITLSAIMSMGVCLFVFPKLLFLLCIIFLMILYAYKFKKDNHDIYRLFMILACVLLAELVFIGATIQVYIPRRASFQYSIVNFILISILMNYCFNEFKNNFKVKFIAFVCCLCISFPTVMFVSFECYRMKQKWDLMLESIAIQKNNGIMDVIVDKETFVSKYWSYGEWSNPDENYSEWPNTSYAEVYGVDTFTAK